MPVGDFLFELGVEEIPAGYIGAAVSKLRSGFETELKTANLSYERIKTYSTPRRFAIKISGLQLQQKDEILEKIGPAKAAAYDQNGNLTPAALGFLRGAGADARDIFVLDTPKGEKIAVRKEIKGKDAKAILLQIIPQIVAGLNFPKSMKWGDKNMNFARPIRWLIAFWENEILPVEINGLKAGNVSYGNRFQKPDNPVTIGSIDEYESRLATVFVIPDREERKQLIQQQLHALFVGSNLRIIEDANLLEIVTDLVEYPTAVLADFKTEYLDLPPKVITSTLSQNQKYFAVQDENGSINNKFVFISNGDPLFSDLIKKGNEKVITARLEDADFFFREDSAISLEKFVSKLSEVTFQEKLGTLLEKTNRIEKLTDNILKNIKSNEPEKEAAQRAALLCKADLVSLMLGEKEFTKLQGYMGKMYALVCGEPQLVADAIYEHYMPRGERDELPATLPGAVVAIADKMDTVCGIIGVDMIPSGSKDPFALRRAANGIVQIIDKFGFEFNLHELIAFALHILEDKLPQKENNLPFLLEYFKQRTEWLLKQNDIAYDVIESVMHIDHAVLPDLMRRAQALQNFKQRPDFLKLVLGFKRVSNIIADQKEAGEVDVKLLSDESEKLLFNEFGRLQAATKPLLAEKKYESVLEELVKFGTTIDKFFDEVLVNVDDADLRNNRYNLLARIRILFLQIADISRIVVENEK
ncbi:MAG TPA: glycine--tRNA ligase subunit beta [Candidatus Cloacimonadota bacterium]|nr:glycine--tRNA ligase subunit beta [Candidatus Cloacimonadota bacterium]